MGQFGIAALNGQPCVEATIARKPCPHDGSFTSHAWGYRVQVSANYPGAFAGVRLTPALHFAQDISGYSHDGVFSRDCLTVRPSLRADWDKPYYAEIQYTRFYNNLASRDHVIVVAGTAY